ncbi:membrane protein [Kitasatospora herbaricolor]|uniref:metallophosphoesterase n=1 Tax=Kitasatospora herbaricolor TaxID=68217 RepID=UPI00174AAA15|nr:metallophosphoesterase [Kitasatospora herbaricolor]MDQ0312321.1 putative MPP superfamily phosphohydrolase [Kitasatospora herbaricolor]GGV15024.1 membrane protein [Kitasatospora herbaricolor]
MIVVVVLALLLALAVVGLAHWYLWRRLVRDVSAPGGLWRRTGTVLAFLLPVLGIGAVVGGRALPMAAERWIAWPGFLWLAVLLYLLLFLLAGELLRPLLARLPDRRGTARDLPGEAGRDAAAGATPAAVTTGPVADPAPEPGTPSARPATPSADPGVPAADVVRPSPAAPVSGGPLSPQRRLFIARTVAIGAAGAAAAVVGNGTYGVLRGPRLKQVTVPLAKLPARADGYRIAVVSDIHLGPILGRAHTQRIVDTVNAARPDLITVVGDLVDGTVPELGRDAEPLARLRAKDGAWFVTGNHEYFSGAAPWVDFVRSLGVHPLQNARVELPGFDLAGVNDLAGTSEGDGPDFDKALGDRDRSRTSVLLSHQPVTVHDAVRHGVDLQLSGHTHGGQLWPGNYLAELANPTVAGLERYGDTQLYVTRGAGAWGPPVRVGAPSDITIVTLVSPRA